MCSDCPNNEVILLQTAKFYKFKTTKIFINTQPQFSLIFNQLVFHYFNLAYILNYAKLRQPEKNSPVFYEVAY